MPFSIPVEELIRRRFSCRSFLKEPIDRPARTALTAILNGTTAGFFGTPLRFALIATSPEEPDLLKGLTTYGFIRHPAGFIAGTCGEGRLTLEEYGHALETIILSATDLDLGTCWLGGTFSKGSFAQMLSLAGEEEIPAVAAIGRFADAAKARKGFIRRQIGADSRLPGQELFFDATFDKPLSMESSGAYAQALEMVRLGPSASNKQPWRIVKQGDAWHFFLQRTKGYREGIGFKIIKASDIQRLDMGIAMCHFELTARALGLTGKWSADAPHIPLPDALTEYTATWIPE